MKTWKDNLMKTCQHKEMNMQRRINPCKYLYQNEKRETRGIITVGYKKTSQLNLICFFD